MVTNARTRSDGSTTLLDHKPLPEGRITFEEFLDWCDDDTRAEWVDGEVIVQVTESVQHHQIVVFLVALFVTFAETHQLGRVFTSFLMRLITRPSGRSPDVLFLSNERLHQLQHTYIEGPADVVVEIVSPDSEERDYEDKVAEYAGAGVPEYWLINPDRRQAQFLQLRADGTYEPVLPDADGSYHSKALPGLRLQVDWLWQTPPPLVEAMRALGIVLGSPRPAH